MGKLTIDSASNFHTVYGAGGVPLNVWAVGEPDAPPIVFLHGLGRCNLDWHSQFASFLAQRYKLVAPDLRGHGNSGKPWKESDYMNSRIWADDLVAVFDQQQVDDAVIVAWSYGGVAILDYLREYGCRNIRAINFVGNLPFLSTGTVPKMLNERYRSQNLIENVFGNLESVTALTATDQGEEWRQQAALMGMATPAYVRRAIYKRSCEASDLQTLTSLF